MTTAENTTRTDSQSATGPPHRIVIIGAGYAGLFAARRAARATRGGRASVTLVDRNAHWVERTRLHQVAAGDQHVEHTALAAFFDGTGVDVVAGEVIALDPDRGQLTLAPTEPGEDSHTVDDVTPMLTTIPFDELVYAVGSSADTARTPGARQHARVLDSAGTAAALAGELTALATGGTVVVVGGGLTGIEAAAEIAEAHPALSTSLVTSGSIGDGLSERGRRHLRDALGRLGVTVLETTGVCEVDATGLVTSSGRRLPADIVVWAAGLRFPDLADRSSLATDDLGRVLVDASLRSVSHPHVLAAGDGAWPVEPVGARMRPSAYTSTIMGAQAGTNVTRRLAGKNPRPLRFGYLMQSISLGRRDGLIQFTDGHDRPRSWVATGRAAAAIKEFVETFMVVGFLRLERRLPGAFAWRPAPRKPLTVPTAPRSGSHAGNRARS